ncbi:MAG: sensor histidine kinase, partial [Lachnospiraceae bacterium]|nr:sensor histidine kinase [Lachnospiraceae bacterium]
EAAPAAKLRDGVDIKKQEWYSLAVGSRENVHFASPTVENLFSTRSTEYTWVVPMSRVVQITRNSHVQSGILVINLRYSGLQDVLSNVLLGENAYIYLTDSGGEILYHPMKQLISGGQVEENNYTTVNLGDGNYVDTLGGQKRDIAIKTVGYTGWKIVGVIPQGSVTLSTFKSNLFVVFLMLFFLTALVVINSYISKRVSYPILKLEQSVKELEEGNWNIPIQASGFYEVRHLGVAISSMALHIEELMSDIVKEHEEKRKSELTALQNQINPHFLYNTLDIIVWMIENERQTEAVRVVTALARFFRISLSRGKNIITVADEIEHVRNYLMIQEMRFKNRFHYTFNVDEDVEELGTIKLILQPLVENSIYHAMEFMDGDGEIEIKGWKENDKVKLLIRDNGCGMTEAEVDHLLYGEPIVSQKGSGVGVRNVQDRIKLLFGEEYGLSIKSEPDEGTDVLVTMPAVAYSDLVKRGLE